MPTCLCRCRPMSSSATFAVLMVAMATVLLGVLGMAPEPDPIPRRWQLTIEPGPLRVAVLKDDEGSWAQYFYLTYKVTNSSKQDLLFTPSFELVTDDGVIRRSGRGVRSEITRQVLDSLDSPFLQDQIGVVGMILQGEANAKEGVVIWPVDDPRITDLSVFAAGFSGEMRNLEVKQPDGTSSRVVLRKTLMLSYQAPGEVRNMGAQPIPLLEKQWIMR